MANNPEEGQGSQRAVVPVMMMIIIYPTDTRTPIYLSVVQAVASRYTDCDTAGLSMSQKLAEGVVRHDTQTHSKHLLSCPCEDIWSPCASGVPYSVCTPSGEMQLIPVFRLCTAPAYPQVAVRPHVLSDIARQHTPARLRGLQIVGCDQGWQHTHTSLSHLMLRALPCLKTMQDHS
jgi:hypothetical protein